ncbi:MAG: hypothetical protein ACFFED_05210 [Candidatus Thorarchaeota archaeon]
MISKRTIIALTIFTLMLGTFCPPLEYKQTNKTSMYPQSNFTTSEEYNISSYIDFSTAALNIILDVLIRWDDGSVFHSGDYKWEMIDYAPSLADFYWTISALSRMYWVSVEEGSANDTISILVSRIATKMVFLLLDPDYPGFGVNTYSVLEARTSKRPGVQAYAYEALRLAEAVNSTLDFSAEQQSAITCLTDMLYDEVNGGFYFFTLQNGSINVPPEFDEVYPNDGKRLDHLALGALALYDASVETSNTTLLNMADEAISFMMKHMKQTIQTDYFGLKLAVTANGSEVIVNEGERPANVVVSDINAIALGALLKAYTTTGNSTYLDFAKETFNALLQKNWDTVHGGWFAETLNGEPFDPLDDEDVKFYKYTEIQFQMTRFLSDLYELTDNTFYVRLVIDTLELVISHLWDKSHGGFVQNGNQEWDVFSDEWEIHYTSVQCQAILSLEKLWSYGLPIISYVRINPSSPRPFDEILITALVQDPDGIDDVYVNYTISFGSVTTSGILELDPNPEAGGVFNSTLGYLNDTTQVNFYVYANDTTGASFVAGSYYFIVREDIWEPAIVLRQIYPEEVAAGDEVILEFGTYEFPLHSALLYCTLFWKVNNGAFTELNMTHVGFEEDYLVWIANLGRFRPGDVISYYCIALDESGNIGISAYYRLTINNPASYISPITSWQFFAIVGSLSLPGFGFAYVWTRRKHSNEQQRILKKEARKRGRRARGKSRSRSRSQGGE